MEIDAQFQELIDIAKGQKADLDMAKLDYKHTMRKLQLLAEQFPAAARRAGVTAEPAAAKGKGKSKAADADGDGDDE